MSAKYNIVCEQATTFDLQFTIKTADVPWDLNGYTATMTVRPFAGATTYIIEATTANGQIVLNGSSGIVDIAFAEPVTAAFIPGRYVYDLIFNSGGTVTRILEGQFIVTAAITTNVG